LIRTKNILEEKEKKHTWLTERFDMSYNMYNGYVKKRQQLRPVSLIANIKILDKLLCNNTTNVQKFTC